MWSTPYFRPLLEKFYLHVVDSCEYGSAHRKETAFLANFDAPRLKQRCRGDHVHAARKVKQLDSGEWAFDTAKEAEYPTELARAISSAFLEELANRGSLVLQDELADHACKISADSPDVPRAHYFWPSRLKVVYGVYFSLQEFAQKVQQLRHLFEIPLPLDKANMASIAFILENGPAAVAKHRYERLNHYIRRAKEFHDDEQRLHQQMDESIRKVMDSKRLLLFKEMLKDAGVNDQTLFQEMHTGFKLVGDLMPSGQFQQQWKPAALGMEQLKQTSVWAQKAVVSSCKRVLEDPEIADAVWNEAIEQAAEGKAWVRGPFTAEVISLTHGDNWIPSRRFRVRQGGKIRAVDDFSPFLVNSTVTCHEQIDLEGIDTICASARCLDLRQAYKQLVRHPEDSWASILAVVNPSDSTVYFFEAVALPFGSVSSVLAFNRAAGKGAENDPCKNLRACGDELL
eukprot:s2267_g7.t1